MRSNPYQTPRTRTLRRAPSANPRRVGNPRRGAGSGRGRSRRGSAPGSNPVLGMISIACFVMFFLVLGIAIGTAVNGMATGQVGQLGGAAVLALLSFAFPIGGLATGLIGGCSRGSNQILAWIGVALNGVLLAYLLLNSAGGMARRKAAAQDARLPSAMRSLVAA